MSLGVEVLQSDPDRIHRGFIHNEVWKELEDGSVLLGLGHRCNFDLVFLLVLEQWSVDDAAKVIWP
jgi:hypothetical protein